MSEYPNGNLLVEVEWLKKHLNDTDLRLLDVRASDPRLPMGYRMGHIPGAISFDTTQELYARTPSGRDVAPPEKIATILGQRGVSSESTIVIYDEWTGQLAAMTFWVLQMVGHRRLHILHGGWAMWQKEHGAVTQETPQYGATTYRAGPNESLRATANWIQANQSRTDLVLLDVRSDGEYGMGHIPGAVNLNWDIALDPQTQMFRDASSLSAHLNSAGVDPSKEIVTYCATGARSSHMFATLQLLGYPRVRNYNGSMMDWMQTRGLPVE